MKQGLPSTSIIWEKDFIQLAKNQTSEKKWIRAGLFLEQLIEEIPIPEPQANASSIIIDYSAITLNAVWNFGNLDGNLSTEKPSVLYSGTGKWHLSNIDLHGGNLDATTSTNTLFDSILDATDGSVVLMKIYNREDPSSYVYLFSETAFVKANPNNTPPLYYDIEFNAEVLSSNNVDTNTIQNPTITLIIGKMYDAIRNNTDTFTSIDKVNNVITLTKEELEALPSTDPNTLYITPRSQCDGANKYLKVHIPRVSSYTASVNEYLHCDATTIPFTITLPTAVSNMGEQISIVKEDNSSNVITIDTTSSETINGELTKTINSQWTSVTLESDGSNWIIT